MHAAGLPIPKRVTEGTHRARTLRETLDRVLPILGDFGITRVADITGLDHIGIPVVMVCRPNGRSLSVSQGKGLTMDAATASGVMESIETHHAETIEHPVRLDTFARLRRSADVIDLDLIANVAHSTFHPDKRIPWIAARGLRTEAEVWVPLELVDLDLTLPRTYARHCFASSSNGLASGNHPLEAIEHALAEVIERDSHALWALGKGRPGDDTRLDLATVNDPGCLEVLERLGLAAMQVSVWDATGPMGVPCFVCRITDARINTFRRIPAAEGAGCHPDRSVALMRALTEAAQSRLTTIAGTRDDKTAEVYRDLRSGSYLEATNEEHDAGGGDRSFRASPLHRSGDLRRRRARPRVTRRRPRAARARVDRPHSATPPDTGGEGDRARPGAESERARCTAGPSSTPTQGGARRRGAGMTTGAVIFAGPTIDAETITDILTDADVRGPAARGHVYRAARAGAAAIGIVDGLYESVPAIWHKEIIYALERGVPVYGASSMGAIRAAELAPFGMIGVGSIFEEFNGPGRPDDYVAVAHGPAETGYACLSTAMVNIEEACRLARESGVIGDACADAMLAEARRRFYPDRRLDEIAHLVLGADAVEFLAFVDRSAIDRKHADAVAMVQRMAADLAATIEQRRRPLLNRTVFFDALVRELDSHDAGSDLVGWSSPVLEELQLDPNAYRRSMLEASRRRYAREFAVLSGAEPDQEAIDRASDELRVELGLLDPAQLEAWLDEVDLDWDSYAALVHRRALEKIGALRFPPFPKRSCSTRRGSTVPTATSGPGARPRRVCSATTVSTSPARASNMRASPWSRPWRGLVGNASA